MTTKRVTYYDDEDNEIEIELPARWEICDSCGGEGKSSAYLGAFTASEMHEEGPEFMEDYMSGFYDRACDRCQGGKVKVIADDLCVTPEQRAALDAHYRQLQWAAEDRWAAEYGY